MRKKAEELENPDHVFCPECKRRYGNMNCRMSYWDEKGRYEKCLSCAVINRKRTSPSQEVL